MLTSYFRKITYMELDDTTMGGRIEIALEAVGLDATKAAPLIGVSREAILQWIDNGTKNLKNANLWKLEDLTGFSARWITSGEGHRHKLDRYLNDPKIVQIAAAMKPMAEYQKDLLIKISHSITEPGMPDKN